MSLENGSNSGQEHRLHTVFKSLLNGISAITDIDLIKKDVTILTDPYKSMLPSIKAMFRDIWMGLDDALSAMPRWEKGFHIFWLLGPFMLLIE